MKALIQEALTATFDREDEGAMFFEETLNRFGVHYQTVMDSTTCAITIPVQKIVLDEYNMNTLFHEVLCFIEHSLIYAPLGGEGCDFAVEIHSNTRQ